MAANGALPAGRSQPQRVSLNGGEEFSAPTECDDKTWLYSEWSSLKLPRYINSVTVISLIAGAPTI